MTAASPRLYFDRPTVVGEDVCVPVQMQHIQHDNDTKQQS